MRESIPTPIELVMKKELKDKHFIRKPVYPGGTKAMQEFLKMNKKYPAKAQELKTEGTVTIRYTINYQGNVIHTNVVAGVGSGCDEEAQRIVSLLKFNVPKTRKMKVQYHKTIHIHFRLPEVVSTVQEYRYNITESPANAKLQKIKSSYYYLVEW